MVPLRSMGIIIRPPVLPNGSHIPMDYLDKGQVRIDMRNLPKCIRDIQWVFSNECYLKRLYPINNKPKCMADNNYRPQHTLPMEW